MCLISTSDTKTAKSTRTSAAKRYGLILFEKFIRSEILDLVDNEEGKNGKSQVRKLRLIFARAELRILRSQKRKLGTLNGCGERL